MSASPPVRLLRPVGPADLDAVHALVEASDIADSGEPDLTRADVAAVLGSPAAEAWAVSGADGTLSACGWVESRSGRPAVEGEFFVAPEADLAVVEPVLERMLLAAALDDDHRPLRLYVNSARPDKCGLLEARGATVVRHFFRMACGLGRTGRDVSLPAGTEIRTIRDEGADLRAMHDVMTEAFADHWGSSPAPYDEWLQRNRGRVDFDASLWWLVSDGGKPVAGLIATVSDREGYVNSLGVRRAHRGRGLARGLLIHAFREFAARGLPQAALSVDAANPTGAVRLYESVGMTPAASWALYELPR
ncbi:MAG TPA: GNAT family N-acetyltransferase [Mycobacteriales bacterium]|jgi:ribosomal protein S18 acetylase RimI-like enzyme|nr:GNAT family N-acetyltransferase [Mycobacteriales bacterium]